MTDKNADKASSRERQPGLEEIHGPLGLMALILRHSFKGAKYNFPTPPDSPLQIGVNFYNAGEAIKAHRHLPRLRRFEETHEFLTINAGRVRLHLYEENGERVYSGVLDTYDSVLLMRGGHGFDVLEPCKVTEVKLGPYDEALDKTHL